MVVVVFLGGECHYLSRLSWFIRFLVGGTLVCFGAYSCVCVSLLAAALFDEVLMLQGYY